MGSKEFEIRTVLSNGIWYNDLNSLPKIIQETEATLCSWLKPEQEWKFKEYGLNDRGTLNLRSGFSSMEFIFVASNPPLLEIKQMFGLRKRSILDLPQIFDPEVVSAYSQSQWKDRELALKTQQVGPFPPDSPPPYKPNDYQERYHVATITAFPFYIYSNKERLSYSRRYPYWVVDENQSRVIIEVLLEDQLPRVTSLAQGREEELGYLNAELSELNAARSKLLKERRGLTSQRALTEEDEWRATLERMKLAPPLERILS